MQSGRPGGANARTARTHQTPALLFQPDSPQGSPQGWGLGELQRRSARRHSRSARRNTGMAAAP